jgi:hypothetical protein
MNSIGYMKLQFDEKLNPFFLETIDLQGNTKTVSMREAGFSKEISFEIIIKREFYSQNGEPKVFYGLQHMLAKIPNERSFKYLWLFKSPDMQNIAISFTDPTVMDNFGNHARVTTLLDISDVQYIKKVGTPKKLSQEELRLKIKNNEVLGIFKDDLKNQLAI